MPEASVRGVLLLWVVWLHVSAAQNLRRAELDLSSGTLDVAFSSVVNSSLTVTSQIFLQNEESATENTTTLFLQSSPATDPGALSTAVSIPLSRNDLNRIKAEPSLGTSASNTFFGFLANTFFNGDEEAVQERDATSALALQTFIEDSVRPELERFKLDVDSGRLTLRFSETVNTSTIDWNQFTFMSNFTSRFQEENATHFQCLHLVDSASDQIVVDDLYVAEVIVQLSSETLNVMKSNPGFGTSSNTTFVAFSEAFVADMNGNPIDAVSEYSAQGGLLHADATQPAIVKFDLDIYKRVAKIVFSETVNITSFDLTHLTLVEADPQSDDTEIFSFSENSTISLQAGSLTIAEMSIGIQDYATLVSFSHLAQSKNTTYLLADEEVVEDMAGLQLTEIVEGSALQVATFSRTGITNFTVNLSSEQILVYFTEDILSVDLTGVVIHSDEVVQEQAYAFYRLTSSSTARINGRLVIIELGNEDLNAIKKFPTLAISRDSTYLTSLYTAFTDLNGFSVSSVTGMKSAMFTPDTVRPTVTEFTLDMDQHLLFITFSETVSWRSFQSTQVTLQEGRTVVTGGESVTLEGASKLVPRPSHISAHLFPEEESSNSEDTVSSSNVLCDNSASSTLESLTPTDFTIPYRLKSTAPVETLDSTTLTIFLSNDDVTRLKERPTLASNYYSTWLLVTNATVQDMVGNQLVPLENGNSIYGSLDEDMTIPELRRWGLDMDQGILSLTFSEIMRASSFRTSEVHLRANPNEIRYVTFTTNTTSVLVQTLTDASSVIIPEVPSRTVEFELGADLDALNLNPYIGNSRASTWITISFCRFNEACPYKNSNATDMAGNFFPGVVWTSPRIADFFVEETTRPELLSFDLNLDIGNMTLYFSAPMMVASIDATYLSLQDRPKRRKAEIFTFSDATVPDTAENGLSITFTLADVDLSILKSFSRLATQAKFTYLTAGSGLGNSTWGLPVKTVTDASIKDGSPLLVNSFKTDTTPAVLTQYYVDLESTSPKIKFVFDEPVDVEAVLWSLFQLRNENSTSSTFVNLTTPSNISYNVGSPIVSVSIEPAVVAYLSNNFTIKVNVSSDDNGKQIPDLYLTVDQSAVTDLINNGFQGVHFLSASLPDCGDCPSGFFQTKKCTSLEDRQCQACSECPYDHYIKQQCSQTEDTACTRCTECPFNTYVAVPCEDDHDRTCERCTVCSRDEFETQECEFGLPRLCATCNNCFLTLNQEKQCLHSSLQWRKQNCFVDTDGDQVIQENVNLNQFYITHRDSRRNEIFCQHANWDTLKIEKTDLNYFSTRCNVKPPRWVDEKYEEQYIDVEVPNPRVYTPGTVRTTYP